MPNGIQPQQNTRYANQFRRNTDNFIVVECDTNVVEAKCMDEIIDDEIVECKETINNQKRDISNLRRDINKIERKVFQLERENRELKKKQLKTKTLNISQKSLINKLTKEVKIIKNQKIIIEKYEKESKILIDKYIAECSNHDKLKKNYKIMNDNREEWKVYSSKLQKTIDELRNEIKTIHKNRDFLKKLHQ